MNKYIAEFFGTTVLTLVVILSLAGTFPISTPTLAALVVGVLVYAMAHVSGTHLNPAVTIAAWTLGKINTKNSVYYILAQFLGAGLALPIARSITEVPILEVTGGLTIGLAEALGTFLLMYAIASFIYGKTTQSTSGIVIGGGLLIGVTIAVLMGSNGLINPAVAFGVSSLNISYVLGPIVGGILGAQFYRRFFT